MYPLPSLSDTQKKKFSQSQPLLTETKQKKERIPRNPLRDVNSRSCVRSSSSSSSSTSVSGELRKGCLRSLLSHSSSSSSSMKTPFGSRPVKSLSRTPISAPVVNARFPKQLSKSRPAFPKENLLKGTVSEKHILQKPQKCKKNPTSLHQGQSGKTPPFKSAPKAKNYFLLSKLSTGSEVVKQKEHENVVRSDDTDAHLTPVTKLGTGSGIDCGVTDELKGDDRSKSSSSNTKTPPVQASVSPEIQCGSSILLSTTTTKTPACYAAGYIVSGVSDKRKCRPKGILTVGNNGLDLGKPKALNDFDDNDEGENAVRDTSTFMMPLPADASMHWLLSPCDEEKDDAKEHSDDGSCQLQQIVECEGPETPSPLSDLGFSSDICNISSSKSIFIDNSGKGMRRRSISSLSPVELSEHGRFMDPLYGSSIVSCLHHTIPTYQTAPSKQLKEERKHRYEPGEDSPFSIDSLGRENVIQTPESDSTPDRYPVHSWLEAEDLKILHVDLDLKSLTTALQSANLSPKSHASLCDPSSSSFRFDSLPTNSGSIDLSQFQRVFGDKNSHHSTFTLDNTSQFDMQISWKDGLNGHILEMDEFDSCRCLSDEEENANGSRNDQLLKCHQGPNTDFDVGNDPISAFGSTEFLDKELVSERKNKEMVQTVFPCSSAESISTDGGGLVCSEDSDWMAYYKNQFFEE